MKPVLVTERLRLAPLSPDDIDDVHALLVQPGVRKYLCDVDRLVASTDAPKLESNVVMRRLGVTFDRREVVGGLDTVFHVISREDLDFGSHDNAVVAEEAR